MDKQKPQLFPYQKEFLLFCAFLLTLFLLHLFYIYHNYQAFILKPFYYTYVTILQSYTKEKNNQSYQVLKVKSEEGLTFYTTTHQKENLSSHRLRLQIFPDKEMKFIDYLGIFYVKSRIKKVVKNPVSLKDRLLKMVTIQHQSTLIQNFYHAIFFAKPIIKPLREKISLLGISHLIALSGFHLGILWAMSYTLLSLIYTPLQQRFFPYRYRYVDMGIVVLLGLFYYTYFVGYPPSLMRSFLMLTIGWGLLLLGVELISFKLLIVVGLLLLLFFPSLMLSLSFWFSLLGVFYIFILLSYTKKLPQWLLMVGVIPFGIFILMLPIVHAIFPLISSYQLLSPLLSLAFIPFYPLIIFLHLFSLGDIFDTLLLKLFTLPQCYTEDTLSLSQLISYLALSFLATRYKFSFMLLLLVSSSYMVYLFIFIK